MAKDLLVLHFSLALTDAVGRPQPLFFLTLPLSQSGLAFQPGLKNRFHIVIFSITLWEEDVHSGELLLVPFSVVVLLPEDIKRCR